MSLNQKENVKAEGNDDKKVILELVKAGPDILRKGANSRSLSLAKNFRKTGMTPGALRKFLQPPQPQVRPAPKPIAINLDLESESDERCQSPDLEIIFESSSTSVPSLNVNYKENKVCEEPEKTRCDSPEIVFLGCHRRGDSEEHVAIPVCLPDSDPVPDFGSIIDVKFAHLPLPTEISSDINGNQVLIEPPQVSSSTSPPEPGSQHSVSGVGPAVLTPHATNRPLVGDRLVSGLTDARADDVLTADDEVTVTGLKGKLTLNHSPKEKIRGTAVEEKENDSQTSEASAGVHDISRENYSAIIATTETQDILSDEEILSAGIRPLHKNAGVVSKNKIQSVSSGNENTVKNIQCSEITTNMLSVEKQTSLFSTIKRSNVLHRVRPKSAHAPSSSALAGRKRNRPRNLELNGGSKRSKLKSSSAAQVEGVKSSIPPNNHHANSTGENKNEKDSHPTPGKVRRLSSVSNGSSTMRIDTIKNRHPVLMSHKQLQEISPHMEKKHYKAVLILLADKIQEVYPPEGIVAEIISSCVLRTTGRTSKEVYLLAVNYFQQLVDLIADKKDISAYFKTIFDKVSEILSSSGKSSLVEQMLLSVKAEFKLKPEEKYALKFFKTFTSLLEKDYEQYISKVVKVRQPLIVHVMIDPYKRSPVGKHSNWGSFLKILLQLPPTSLEVIAGMEWIDLMAKHYENYGTIFFCKNPDFGRERFIDEFILNLTEGRHADYGLEFVKLLKKTQFTLELCRALICTKLSNVIPRNDDWTNILRELSAYLNLKSNTTEGVNQVDQPSTIPLSPHHGNPDNALFASFLSTQKNTKGETILHLASRRKDMNIVFQEKKYTIQQVFARMKRTRCGDINVRDNAGQTPLLDASYHGSTNVVASICEHFTNVDEPRGPLRVDLLAQDHEGFTALHNALSKNQDSCIRLILHAAKVLECKTELLKMQTSSGKTVWDFLPDCETNGAPEGQSIRNLLGPPPTMRNFFGGVKFPPDVVLSVDKDIPFQVLLLYWRELYELLNPLPVLPLLS